MLQNNAMLMYVFMHCVKRRRDMLNEALCRNSKVNLEKKKTKKNQRLI
jgi:hypothetical protein